MKSPSKFAVLLFDSFQALDVFGPLDVLNMLAMNNTLELSIISTSLDPVTACTGPSIGQNILPTHDLHNSPEDIEVLLVPGGRGTRDTGSTQPQVDFIKSRYPKLRYLLTVCTGAALAARAGVLDGKKATSNKAAFEWVKTQGEKVDWVPGARWVKDGTTWTSSGISAGIDMMYAFIADQYGENAAEEIARRSEYVRNTDPSNDPFSKSMAA
ncbi:Isonitrile hydratase [Metarhizium anisopliae]|nr:Isonitrile hydratase [Metarhizium anisopliae]